MIIKNRNGNKITFLLCILLFNSIFSYHVSHAEKDGKVSFSKDIQVRRGTMDTTEPMKGPRHERDSVSEPTLADRFFENFQVAQAQHRTQGIRNGTGAVSGGVMVMLGTMALRGSANQFQEWTAQQVAKNLHRELMNHRAWEVSQAAENSHGGWLDHR